MNSDDYARLVALALEEDLGDRGDVTSSALFSDEKSQAVLLSKDSGILAGAEVFRYVFHQVDKETTVEFAFSDGDGLSPGDCVAQIRGKILSILTAERTALNFISFLSGIATLAAGYVRESSRAGKTVVLDTRKTLPGYRRLSKYAVKTGGAANHRMGLYDMVLLKDNHIDFAGSITEAVKRVRARWSETLRVEVECRTLEEVSEAIECGVDVVMLDNMDDDTMITAVDTRNNAAGRRPELEASGNIGLSRIAAVSATGVDFVSVGGMTHSVSSFDFSLKTDIPA